MHRSAQRNGFTLIEMITVVAILVLLAGLVIGTASVAVRKAGLDTALGEIKDIDGAIQNYRIDNGTVPQNTDSDLLAPRLHFSPAGGNSASYYQSASLFLYQALSGDLQPPTAPDGKPEDGTRHYYTFPPGSLNVARNGGGITRVFYVQDPFGNSYGYSTAGLKLEAEYRKALKTDSNAPRPTDMKGFNAATYDMWSTGGATTPEGQSKWVRNWGG